MQKKHFGWILILIIMLTLLAAEPTKAEEVGRYQAVYMDSKHKPGVIILDSKDGHLWLSTRTTVEGDRDIYRIVYLGQVRPGEKVGEVIEHGKKKKKK